MLDFIERLNFENYFSDWVLLAFHFLSLTHTRMIVFSFSLTHSNAQHCFYTHQGQGGKCVNEEIVCFIATRKILGIYISVVNSSRRTVLNKGC